MISIIHTMKSIDDFFGKIAKYLTGLSILVMMSVVFLTVIFRYALHNPLHWGDELARYLLIAVTFIGGYAALREGMLAKIDLLLIVVPERINKFLYIIVCLSIFLFSVLLTYYGTKLVFTPSILMQHSPALWLPMVYMYSLIPLASFFMSWHSFVEICRFFVKEGERA